MKQFAKEAWIRAKEIPKSVWVAAAIVPGGFLIIGTYLTIKVKKERDTNGSPK